MCLINKFLALLIPLTRYVLSSNSYYIWLRKERKNCFHFLQQNWMGSSLLPVSYAQIEDSLGRNLPRVLVKGKPQVQEDGGSGPLREAGWQVAKPVPAPWTAPCRPGPE